MPAPQVVIVGRPNVGKSSLFNWLVGRRLAIVDDVAGVTRDRMTHLIHHEDTFFELVDTGGMGVNDVDNLTKEIQEQIELAIESADVILLVVDTRSGLVPFDQEVSKRLRYTNKPILCVANKTDSESLDPQADEFYRLGRGKLIAVSTRANRRRNELFELIVQRLPASSGIEVELPEDPLMKVAIVGRRNVGKSTFVNTLASAERMIVSEVAGTTRDSVDVRFELDGKGFVAIDTAGLQRNKSIKTDVDFYSMHRAKRSIRHADLTLMFFDGSGRISKVDKHLCNYIVDQYKPCMFVVNKWDLMRNQTPTSKWVSYLHETFPTMSHVPIAFVTGQTGKNVKALLNHAQNLFRLSSERVATSELNKLIRYALDRNPPPMFQNRRPKIYYATQIGIQPPTIVLVCNMPGAFSAQYQRYLLGVLRDQLEFGEVPIKLYLNTRKREDSRDDVTREKGSAGSDQVSKS